MITMLLVFSKVIFIHSDIFKLAKSPMLHANMQSIFDEHVIVILGTLKSDLLRIKAEFDVNDNPETSLVDQAKMECLSYNNLIDSGKTDDKILDCNNYVFEDSVYSCVTKYNGAIYNLKLLPEYQSLYDREIWTPSIRDPAFPEKTLFDTNKDLLEIRDDEYLAAVLNNFKPVLILNVYVILDMEMKSISLLKNAINYFDIYLFSYEDKHADLLGYANTRLESFFASDHVIGNNTLRCFQYFFIIRGAVADDCYNNPDVYRTLTATDADGEFKNSFFKQPEPPFHMITRIASRMLANKYVVVDTSNTLFTNTMHEKVQVVNDASSLKKLFTNGCEELLAMSRLGFEEIGVLTLPHKKSINERTSREPADQNRRAKIQRTE